jgi:hypothetical protein
MWVQFFWSVPKPTIVSHHKLHGSRFGNNSHVNFFFIGSYGIDTDVIHLFVLFEHQCRVHYLNMNVICLFLLFKHECCVCVHIVYTQKLCTWLPCLNNVWDLCVNDTNPWNNIFHMNLEWTHEAYKFVMHFFCIFNLVFFTM